MTVPELSSAARGTAPVSREGSARLVSSRTLDLHAQSVKTFQITTVVGANEVLSFQEPGEAAVTLWT
jgi:hypothetical protein